MEHIQSGVVPTLRTAVIWAALRRELDRRAGETLHVVDVGGGTGGFAVPFAEFGHAVTVIDASPDALASLARRTADAGVVDRLTAVQGDGDQLGSLVAPASVDIVLCHSVLEEVDDPAAVMSAIAAVLRPGGVASIVVANRNGAVLARALAGQMAAARALISEPSTAKPAPAKPATAKPSAANPATADPATAEPSTLASSERRRYDSESATALVRAAGFTVEAIAGVRVIADLMPGALADADPAGALDFELAAAGIAPFRDIATQLHLLARVADRP